MGDPLIPSQLISTEKATDDAELVAPEDDLDERREQMKTLQVPASTVAPPRPVVGQRASLDGAAEPNET